MTLPPRAVAAALGVAAVLLVGALAVTPLREPFQRAVDRSVVAAPATVDAQRDAAERAIARGHAKGVDQVRRTRELRLPVSEEEAARVADRGLDALAGIRRDALAALAGALGLRDREAAAYVLAAEGRIEGKDFERDQGTLLAPSLYTIVARANELFAQAADSTTRELTRPPSPSPSPSRPSPVPSPTGR